MLVPLSVTIANPAGNITAYISTQVKPELREKVASALMKQSIHPIEQVAYLVPPHNEAADGRIEMSGEEFCGNATRAFGYALSVTSEDKRPLQMVEISGHEGMLPVSIDHDKNTSTTEMPLPQELKTITYEGNHLTAVCFEGIAHLIVPAPAPSESKACHMLNAFMETVPDRDAYGIMYFTDGKLTPLVFVPSVGSLVWEGSCGSGSVATAVFLSQTAQGGDRAEGAHSTSYALVQPGGTLEVTVERSGGQISHILMGGSVTVEPEFSFCVEL
eukprot:gnl/Dysnectes_brevis/694_a766_4773.p1 GENE.gnl/Dysnectes_brevis/694_a766_4773~~gnl/Dysnectes_brevis/694_a766_4773.p1  ORF type:complete len:273 (+),score=52.83 gnl/Dysnectes_brevis/694_a766_4773:131-949(+)